MNQPSGMGGAISSSVMLKITMHDSASEFRLKLEGRLSGPWVGELRQCWRTATSTTEGRETVLDLREVDFVDPDGQHLVAEMNQGGVRVLAATPLIQAMVEEVCGGSAKGLSRSHIV
jgi:hypothetical protein